MDNDLISRSKILALIDEWKSDYLKFNGYSFDDDFDVCTEEALDKVAYIAHMIEKAPASDVAEVKHGEWIDNTEGMWTCSNCRSEIVSDEYSHIDPAVDFDWIYCPYCGAKMT